MTIRLASAQDAPELRRIYAPIVERTTLSFETEPPPVDEMARRVESALEFAPWIVWEEGAELLGYAYAVRFRAREAYRWTCEVSAYVDPRAQRRGVARALYLCLFDVLADQGFRTALAVIALPNPASVAFHEALGFQRVGRFRDTGFKHGAWLDTGWWSRALGPGCAPHPPRSVAESWSRVASRA